MTNTSKMSAWAETQMKSKYAHTKADGTKETWPEIAHRVATSVFSAVNAPSELVTKVETAIRDRKFMPGGRYLYASGNDYHQTQNCLLLRAEDSREGWCELQNKAGMALMTGAGIGVDYSDIRPEGSPIRKTGGVASGPLALMNILNEAGRHYRQGGSRRSAIWAGLNWKHPDVFKFIQAKNWSDDIKALKEKDFNAWAPLDGTNISVQLDDEFFVAYHDPAHADHVLAKDVYWLTVRQMLETAEPGFSVDVGENAGETLRNAPVSARTRVYTDRGYVSVGEIVGIPTTVWTGKQWAKDVVFEKTGDNVPVVRVRMSNGMEIVCDPTHEFILDHGPRIKAMYLVSGARLKYSPPFDTYANYTQVFVESVERFGREDVFCADVKVPEHSFMAEGVIISNCTEITSRDDSDICNLGSINLARIETLDEFLELVEIATAFLIAGTVYSDVPYPKVAETRTKNRRIGLGLMGVHEWLLVRGKKYGPDVDLQEWMQTYQDMSDFYAMHFSILWGLSEPVKVRAHAPTGTISIVAETTSGIEPLFCVAYKRRYKVGNETHYQLVLDPAAKRLVESGVDPTTIEDAYTLAEDVERRVKFQVWMQSFVDHGISSTINLPAWGSRLNNENTVRAFGDMLIRYLPSLRGVTVYPDGARGGQPLNPVSWSEALGHEGEVFVEQADVCDISGKGTCGA